MITCRRHEPILYEWKPGADHNWYGGRKQSTVIEEAAPIIVREDNEGALLTFTAGIQMVTIRVPSFEVLQSGDDSMSTVWRFEKPLRNGEHPTMKPIGLCARAIQNSSTPGEYVIWQRLTLFIVRSLLNGGKNSQGRRL